MLAACSLSALLNYLLSSLLTAQVDEPRDDARRLLALGRQHGIAQLRRRRDDRRRAVSLRVRERLELLSKIVSHQVSEPSSERVIE